jgi:hypothetical protein
MNLIGTRNMRFISLGRLAVLAALTGLALLPAANANGAVYTLNTAFNGTAPTSTPPWLTADFETVSTGTVTLTLTSGLEVASEFITEIGFNVNPSIVPSDLSIAKTSGSPSPVNNGIHQATQNVQDLNGGGTTGKGFDVLIDWATANNGNRFGGSDSVTFTITLAGLTAADFDFVNAGGPNGDSTLAHVGAHVQGIPTDRSGAIKDGSAVPEPSTLLVWSGLGVLGLALAWRKRNRVA